MDDRIFVTTEQSTVVIASHDLGRWRHLAAALDSVLAQSVQAPIVVAVDHNEELRAKIQRSFPMVRAVPNKFGQGASGTRNSGAQLAETPLIAFLDDDARAESDWLEKLLAPLSSEQVVGTGGGVEADWETGRPDWFPEEFDWVVGASFRGQPTTTTPIRNVWSENMAVRRSVFEAVGGFRLDFGKVGERSRPEDTDLCIRMAAAVPGSMWMYVPDALAYHHVPPSRSTFRFFVRRSYLEGRGKVEMARLIGRQERLASEREYMTRTLPNAIRRSLRRDPQAPSAGAGLLKAAAITTGVGAAGVGAVTAMVSGARHGATTPSPSNGPASDSSTRATS